MLLPAPAPGAASGLRNALNQQGTPLPPPTVSSACSLPLAVTPAPSLPHPQPELRQRLLLGGQLIPQGVSKVVQDDGAGGGGQGGWVLREGVAGGASSPLLPLVPAGGAHVRAG